MMTTSFSPTREQAREYTARWLMEFGSAPVAWEVLASNKWYRDIAAWNPIRLLPYMQRSTEEVEYYVTQEGFDLLKGGSDDEEF